jgi:RHS repeat-associated protein
VDWTLVSREVPAGTHTLKWCYVKDGSGYDGDDCGWVDFVQWTGPSPAQDPSNWQQIAYKHNVTGRRVEKKVDGYSTRYLCNAQMWHGHLGRVLTGWKPVPPDGNNNLLRKYIYAQGSTSPPIRVAGQPVSMIEVADANAVYYYHFDALGSVVALSDAAGDTVQTYEYSVYGEVAVEDANHPNPYMFAGVRYDIEIGLHYNRARYYNPFMGRFLQTDHPIISV